MGLIKQVISIKKRVTVDIVFCIDCSFSMSPVLGYIKKAIIKFFKEELEDLAIDGWRARIVGFRDDITCDNPFVTTVDEIMIQLNGVKAKGDIENKPAPVFETIKSVVDSSEWQHPHAKKIILLFTDTTAKAIDEQDMEVFAEELSRNLVCIFLWGKKDSLYDNMRIIPKSYIEQIVDPMDFYYHYSLDFGNVILRICPDLTDLADDKNIL